MPGVPRELVEHALNMDPKAKPVKQPLRRFDEPKRKAIASELHKLENAGFIREIKTSTWVSNPVIVPKKNTDVQRVCVDYTSLNKHCPKDPFPLPRIQVYIDDVVITTRKEESLISDLAETFDNLNRYKLKLNPIKCSFGVSAGQLLGFLVLARGIEVNLEKIQAILTMGKPIKLHDVQKLAGRVAALSRIVAWLGEKALPFYALMKKSDDKFEWMEEADTAFAQLKKVLSTPPVLVAPK
jgi:hypothetical protein